VPDLSKKSTPPESAAKWGPTPKGQYVSTESFETMCRKDIKNAEFLKQAILGLRNARPLALRAWWPIPCKRKAADYYATLAGMEAYANEHGMNWMMLTVTLPACVPRQPGNGHRQRGRSTWSRPTDANKLILASVGEITFSRQTVESSSCRVCARCEGMADGTPHMHAALFYKGREELDILCEGLLRQYPEGLRIRETYFDAKNRLQSRYRQYDSLADFKAGKWHTHIKRGAVCQLDIGAMKTGDPVKDDQIRTCTGYVLKYVMKSLGDVERLQASVTSELERLTAEEEATDKKATPPSTPREDDEPTKAQLAAAFPRVHGIRAVQFFGVPRGIRTGWRALRKIRLPLSGELPKGVGPHM